ncbi:hypothetical protein WR25_16927 [Diploscapter pachys]|uniref:Uncharacterized protein n=1 Tax=Diploscapter pachys TaxID=2018661 RepID=A0A2A2JPB8_9BILA|nr:hypothetical protein WR25_16927 [Diploscapter pachys]
MRVDPSKYGNTKEGAAKKLKVVLAKVSDSSLDQYIELRDEIYKGKKKSKAPKKVEVTEKPHDKINSEGAPKQLIYRDKLIEFVTEKEYNRTVNEMTPSQVELYDKIIPIALSENKNEEQKTEMLKPVYFAFQRKLSEVDLSDEEIETTWKVLSVKLLEMIKNLNGELRKFRKDGISPDVKKLSTAFVMTAFSREFFEGSKEDALKSMKNAALPFSDETLMIWEVTERNLPYTEHDAPYGKRILIFRDNARLYHDTESKWTNKYAHSVADMRRTYCDTSKSVEQRLNDVKPQLIASNEIWMKKKMSNPEVEKFWEDQKEATKKAIEQCVKTASDFKAAGPRIFWITNNGSSINAQKMQEVKYNDNMTPYGKRIPIIRDNTLLYHNTESKIIAEKIAAQFPEQYSLSNVDIEAIRRVKFIERNALISRERRLYDIRQITIPFIRRTNFNSRYLTDDQIWTQYGGTFESAIRQNDQLIARMLMPDISYEVRQLNDEIQGLFSRQDAYYMGRNYVMQLFHSIIRSAPSNVVNKWAELWNEVYGNQNQLGGETNFRPTLSPLSPPVVGVSTIVPPMNPNPRWTTTRPTPATTKRPIPRTTVKPIIVVVSTTPKITTPKTTTTTEAMTTELTTVEETTTPESESSQTTSPKQLIYRDKMINYWAENFFNENNELSPSTADFWNNNYRIIYLEQKPDNIKLEMLKDNYFDELKANSDTILSNEELENKWKEARKSKEDDITFINKRMKRFNQKEIPNSVREVNKAIMKLRLSRKFYETSSTEEAAQLFKEAIDPYSDKDLLMWESLFFNTYYTDRDTPFGKRTQIIFENTKFYHQ